MPAATVASRTTGAFNTDATSHTVTKPGGLSSSQGVLVCFTHDTATATAGTSSTGWSKLASQAQGTTTNLSGHVFWAVNASTAANLVVDLSTAESATYALIVINDPGTPEVTGANGGSASTAGIPTLSLSTSGNWLGVAYVGTDSSTTQSQTFSTPTGYSNGQTQNPTTSTSAATYTAERSYTGVGSISPGSVTLGTSEQWVAFTIAFPGQTSGGGGETTPVVRSVTSAADDNSPTVAPAKPSGLAVGDYLLSFHNSDTDGTLAAMTAPSGFTLLGEDSVGNGANGRPCAKLWGKVATTDDVNAASFAFPDGTGANCTVVLVAIQAGTYDTTTPVSGVTWNSGVSTTSLTAPSITGTAGALLMTGHLAETNNTTPSFTGTPSGMTLTHQSVQNSPANTYTRSAVYQQALASDGATGTKTATMSGTARGFSAVTFQVNPGAVMAGVSSTRFLIAGAV